MDKQTIVQIDNCTNRQLYKQTIGPVTYWTKTELSKWTTRLGEGGNFTIFERNV